jgi:FkbM family methyltransferase
MSTEIIADHTLLARALARAGQNEELRRTIFEALRRAEGESDNPASFREQVRWPLILALLSEAGTERVRLENGLIFEVGADSRIEQALLLSSLEHPDHVWEPQTTKLLTALAADAGQAIVGGAYIGDHVLPMAHVMARSTPPGEVHAFEPMSHAFNRLLRNLELNNITNVAANRLGLWDTSDTSLSVEGQLALASSVALEDEEVAEGEDVIKSVTIDDYVKSRQLPAVGLIMLDTEGGEERALKGALALLERPFPQAPHVVFEIHRHFVDWSDGLENTSVVKLLTSRGYTVYAIRDFHLNYPMAGKPIEIIPVDKVYLEGPPHGFNALATKDAGLVSRLGLSIVENVSPKLLLDRDPSLHHPVGGL